MARYRDIDMSARLLPVSLEGQIVRGTFAHAVYHLVTYVRDELGRVETRTESTPDATATRRMVDLES